MDMFTPYITEIDGNIESIKNKLVSLIYSDINYEVKDGVRYGLQKAVLCYTLKNGQLK
jgi:hypothetical protein